MRRASACLAIIVLIVFSFYSDNLLVDAKEIEDFTPIFEAIAIYKISPSTPKGGEIVTISGQGFVASSRLIWDGSEINSTFVTGNQLEFVVPSSARCGPHDIQIENPPYAVGSLLYPSDRSNVRELTVLCGPGARDIAPALKMTSMQPMSGGSGTKVIVLGASFEAPYTKVIFGNEVVRAEVDHPGKLTFLVPDDAKCGTHIVRLRKSFANLSTTLSERTFSFEVRCHEPGSVPQLPASQLGEFDTDSDCQLSANEFITAVDAWISASLANDVFFAALDAWVGQTSICGLSARSLDEPRILVSKVHSPTALYFAAQRGALKTAIEIYDMNGRSIFQSDEGRRGLLWDLRDSDGVRVANGVYFYRATITRADGSLAITGIEKFAVIR